MYKIKKEVYEEAKRYGYATDVSTTDGKIKAIMLPNKQIDADYKGNTCLIYEHEHFEIVQ